MAIITSAPEVASAFEIEADGRAALSFSQGERAMAIKDIFLPLVSYPTPTTVAAIEKGVAIAGYLGADISATAVELEVPAPARPFTGAFVLEGLAPVEEAPEHQKSLLNSRQMLEAFEVAAKSSKVGHTRTIAPCSAEEMAALLVSRSRLSDLSLIAVKDYDGGQEKMINSLLFESGRPLLLFSEQSVSKLSNSFDHVAIAWDHSAQAARAVGDALPLLQSAKVVHILTAADKSTRSLLESGKALVGHLAKHGVEASFEMPKIDGSSVGKVFEAYVKANSIDLLVMGAYRHSRLREFVMGGATYTVLGQPPCWVLMAH
jgi:nucleotide-binding universal stress UspA family protein